MRIIKLMRTVFQKFKFPTGSLLNNWNRSQIAFLKVNLVFFWMPLNPRRKKSEATFCRQIWRSRKPKNWFENRFRIGSEKKVCFSVKLMKAKQLAATFQYLETMPCLHRDGFLVTYSRFTLRWSGAPWLRCTVGWSQIPADRPPWCLPRTRGAETVQIAIESNHSLSTVLCWSWVHAQWLANARGSESVVNRIYIQLRTYPIHMCTSAECNPCLSRRESRNKSPRPFSWAKTVLP